MHLHPLFTLFSLLPPSKDFLIFCNFTMGYIHCMNHSVCSSVCQRRFVFWPGTFFCLIIVLAYLAYGCINLKIKHCVPYIHDSDTTMIYGIYIIFGNWVYHYESMCHIPDPNMLLTFDFKVNL